MYIRMFVDATTCHHILKLTKLRPAKGVLLMRTQTQAMAGEILVAPCLPAELSSQLPTIVINNEYEPFDNKRSNMLGNGRVASLKLEASLLLWSCKLEEKKLPKPVTKTRETSIRTIEERNRV